MKIFSIGASALKRSCENLNFAQGWKEKILLGVFIAGQYAKWTYDLKKKKKERQDSGGTLWIFLIGLALGRTLTCSLTIINLIAFTLISLFLFILSILLLLYSFLFVVCVREHVCMCAWGGGVCVSKHPLFCQSVPEAKWRDCMIYVKKKVSSDMVTSMAEESKSCYNICLHEACLWWVAKGLAKLYLEFKENTQALLVEPGNGIVSNLFCSRSLWMSLNKAVGQSATQLLWLSC